MRSTLRAPSSSTGTETVGIQAMSADCSGRPASVTAVRIGVQVGGLGDHLEGVAEVVDLLGAGVEHGDAARRPR